MAWICCRGPAVCALFAIASLVTGCTTRAEDDATRVIPGTDEVAIEQFCITVSHGERWLTFVEWRLPAEARVNEQMSSEYDTRIVSLNLQTGLRTQHSIDSLSPSALGFPSNQTRWKFHAGFRIIKELFRPPGWIGETFYFQRYDRRTYLALDPSQSDIKIVAEPDRTGTCSDCPPMTSVEFHGRSWDLLSDDISAVVQDGRVFSIYYRESRPNRTNAILRVRDGSEGEVIVERHQQQGTRVMISGLRVSPDQRYLAYIVRSKKQEFLSGPREELFIRELRTGEEKLITSYGSIGNLIWSPAGERLYFAGGGIASDGAVRIVDVAAAFSQ